MNVTTVSSSGNIISERNFTDFFLVINGIIIFIMQGGFAFLEAGSVQSKNVVHTLLINYVNLSLCAVVYWAFGFAFAFGDGNWFIGYNYWLLLGATREQWSKWFFHFAFAATSCTIVSGAVVERVQFGPFAIFLFVTGGLTYPVASHWVWSNVGWLSILQFKDAAGSGVVHVTGGIAALVAALALGPRAPKRQSLRKRFQASTVKLPYHNLPLITLGSFMLFLGFLSFNGASINIRELGENWGQFYSRGAVNTILSSSSSAMCVVLFSRVRDGKWSLIKVINGSICGMVAVCAGCSHVEPWAGFLTGLIAGFVYLAWSDVVPRFGVDDPLDAVAVHAGGGTWGLFAVALLDADRGLLLHWDSASGKECLLICMCLVLAVAICGLCFTGSVGGNTDSSGVSSAAETRHASHNGQRTPRSGLSDLRRSGLSVQRQLRRLDPRLRQRGKLPRRAKRPTTGTQRLLQPVLRRPVENDRRTFWQ